jgi:PKD repeat protein
MNKNILKFGLIPLIIVLVAFSYNTLAAETDTTQNSLGINEETIILLREATSQVVSEIDPEMDNVIAFDISNEQDTSDFTSFISDLEALGYTVVTIDITIDGIPDNVEKLIISSISGNLAISEPYSESEAIMLEEWVYDGGELMVLAEWGPSYTQYTEEISEEFGVTQNSDVVMDTNDYDTLNSWIIYEDYNLEKTHQIFYDVTSIEFLASCSLDTKDGVIIRTDDDGTASPSDTAVAIAKEWGSGRVAIFGDYNWIAEFGNGYNTLDNSKMAINTILWLNGIIMPPPGADSIRLIAGQDIYIGDVYVWNDNDDFHVLYRTFDDWYLLETHLQVNKTEPEIPQTKKGNPIPGHFEFSESFNIADYVNDWYISFPIPEDMTYGETIVIAAHAEVAHATDGCIDIVSDETTQNIGLTSGKPIGNSVYAWEHPAWSTPKSEFTLGAEWIWESEYVYDPELDNWVFFTKEFVIPGLYPIELLGEIKITCDNEYYDLMLNWISVGSDDVWQTVEIYDISNKLEVGANEIEIMTKNLGVPGSTITTNPAGLIYETEVCYEVVDQEESAWGEGEQFNPHPKRNWGMYFEYTINWPPVAVINPIDTSVPWCDPVLFDGKGSYDPDGTVVTYYWDFGDGTTSFNPTPVHNYPGIGTYTVTLTVTDNDGATDTTTTTVEVYNTPPVAEFTYDQPSPEFCEPIHFYDASSDSDPCDTLIHYWDFGDGQTSTDISPVHTYDASGTYSVTLTVTDGYGATDTISYDVTVINNPPHADFYPDDWSLYWCDQPFQFWDVSTDPDWCDSLTYEWDFGDGSPINNDQNPTHEYSWPGTYTVTLTVTDEAGESDSYSSSVDVYNDQPYADFSADDWSLYWCDQPFQFWDNSNDNDFCDSLTYEWDFGDGSPINNDQNPTHEYSWPGTYTVTLIVTDQFGSTDSHSDSVDVINEQPVADFSANQNTLSWCEQPFEFYDYSYDNDGCGPLTYDWDFGDGETSSDQEPSHTYVSTGTYTVTLTVTDGLGVFDIYSQSVTVTNEIPYPDFDWSPYEPEPGEPVYFTDYSYDNDPCDSLSWYWQFGDGATSTDQHPSHGFATDGSYTVRLEVTDGYGDTDYIERTANVYYS